MSHAAQIKRFALLHEIDRLKKHLPDTENTRRNVAAIESQRPLGVMNDTELASYLDLLARSVTPEALCESECTEGR